MVARRLLPLLLTASSLAGCAAPSAGAASSPVTIHLWGTLSGTTTVSVTITPTTEAKQDAKNSTDVDAKVPGGP